MECFKEFEGKSLDLAIQEACEYYNTVREKLEIEIVQDAKSGIFGLVGARKAKIRARRAALREVVATALGRAGQQEAESASRPSAGDEEKVQASRSSRGERSQPRRAEAAPAEQRRPRPQRKSAPRAAAMEREDASAGRDERTAVPAPAEPAPAAGATARPGGRRSASVPEVPPAGRSSEDTLETPDDVEGMAPASVEIDPERLASLAVETVSRLVRPIAGDAVVLNADVQEGRVRVSIDGVEDSGLLIGREGQTLAALQYLASRIVSRAVNAAVRVQLDAGRYRQRQDEKLREIALALAERVRQTGRSFSTRPLSSYHRRIVHLALQDASDVQTRSTGDGPLKRVIVCRRRPDRGQD